ncbi:MAG: YlzJ-like family protein [Clostridia bacterium]|nr:YlzJ-like family protein [Clostridia bacterium]
MVLYTPLLIEEVLKDYDKIKEFKEINYQGRKLQVEMLENGQYRIARILSSSPQDFLDPKLQPGIILQNEILESY